jgi:hypothetical protein
MKKWSDWEVIRRQVTIAGCIVDEQNNPVVGAEIKIKAMAGKFKAQVENAAGTAGAEWDFLKNRPDRTLSRLDGLYFFLDLPEGQYTVSTIGPRSGKIIESRVTVSKDNENSGRITQVDFKLPA